MPVVSSLYGRVYRTVQFQRRYCSGFLPVREGVSYQSQPRRRNRQFPPCTGGCIGRIKCIYIDPPVSSLYGRVYHLKHTLDLFTWSFLPVREGVSLKLELVGKQFKFPPCMGGCIEVTVENLQLIIVSSLHGRVYRRL